MLAITLAFAWVLLLLARAVVISHQVFHWDEFWYLSNLHMFSRDQPMPGFQVFHAVLFAWLPSIGDEITQLRIARWVMLALLALSSWLLYAIARRWTRAPAALFAPVAFLSFQAVTIHGASFRSDSLLLPLVLLVAWHLSAPIPSRRHLFAAGAWWGLGLAITIKAVLFAPVAAVVLLADRWPGFPTALRHIASIGLAAALALGFCLIVQNTMHGASPDPATTTAAVGDVGAKVFSGLFPLIGVLHAQAAANPALWLALVVALVVLVYRRSALAGLSLSLLPVVFYRNTFEYYYLVMLAPTSIVLSLLAQILIDRARLAAVLARTLAIASMALLLLALYLSTSLAMMTIFRKSTQDHQVQVVRMIHAMFPRPVPYIDHSGVLASFPKVNGFLSTWGLENYRAAGQPFMPSVLSGPPAPLLLADRDVLAPAAPRHDMLMPADRALIKHSYVHWWGPVWLAGATLPSSPTPTPVNIHIPGSYRLQAANPVSINGEIHRPGSIIKVHPGTAPLLVSCPHQPCHARLVWDKASRAEVPIQPLGAFFSLTR